MAFFRRNLARRAALVILLAAGLLPAAPSLLYGASKDSRPAAGPMTPTLPPRSSPPAAMPAPAAAPVVPAQAANGICQCVLDHDQRNLRCLRSAAECETACGGSNRYSFVPNAPNCSVSAQGR